MNTMYRSLVGVLALSTAMSFIQAFAQSPTPATSQPRSSEAAKARAASPEFEQVDANKDGSVDKREANAVPGLIAVFDKADANRDGKLNKAEFRMAEGLMNRS